MRKKSHKLKHRLNLELTPETMDRLIWLRGATDATSMTEVIKNALKLYELNILKKP